MRALIVLLFLAAVVMLQIFLSKREGRWPGLVLPGIAFLFGLLYPLNMIAPPDGSAVGIAGQVVLVWFIGNIPTIVLLAVYFGCRKGKHRNKPIDKMNIQDL